MPGPPADPGGVRVFFGNPGAKRIFAGRDVLLQRPVIKLIGLGVVLLPPAGVLGKPIQIGNPIVQFHEIESRALGFLRRGRPIVEFSDGGRRIARLLQPRLHQNFAAGQGRVVHAVFVRVRIPPGEKTHPRGHAHRRLHEHARKVRPLLRQPIEVWRADLRISIRAHAIPPVLVRHQEQDVGMWRCLCLRLGRERRERRPQAKDKANQPAGKFHSTDS